MSSCITSNETLAVLVVLSVATRLIIFDTLRFKSTVQLNTQLQSAVIVSVQLHPFTVTREFGLVVPLKLKVELLV